MVHSWYTVSIAVLLLGACSAGPFGRKQGVKALLPDVACKFLDLYHTPLGQLFSSKETTGPLRHTFCARPDARPKRVRVVTVCGERYQNMWKWLAPAVFPDDAVQIIVSDDASWAGHSAVVPDIAFCSCSQDKCHSEAMKARRKELLAVSGRQLGARLRKRLGVWDGWKQGFVWPRDSLAPAFSPGKWPLLVKYSLEGFGSGSCDEWDLNLEVKWNQRKTMDPTETDYAACPSMFFPFALSHFAHRADKAVADLIVPSDFDAAAELRRKKNFAAFVVGNCGKLYNSGLRMAFFQLLSEYKVVHAKSWCYREKNPGGPEGPIRPIAEYAPNSYHVGPQRRGDSEIAAFVERDRLPVERDPNFRRAPHGNSTEDIVTIQSYYDGTPQALREYKFALVFENARMPGWFTEKLVNAKLAHSIPIFFGPPAEFLHLHTNKDAYVHCNIPNSAHQHVPRPEGDREGHLDPEKRDNIDAWVTTLKEAIRLAVQPCLRQIQQLDADDKQYMRMISTSLLPQNRIQRGGFWDIMTYGAKIRSFVDSGSYQRHSKIFEPPASWVWGREEVPEAVAEARTFEPEESEDRDPHD